MEDGKKFDFTYLKILEILPDSGKGRMAKVICRLCNNTFIKRASRVEGLEQKSCGCINSLYPKQDITGQTVNNILFVGFEGKGLWRVKFACGHEGTLCNSRATNSATSNCSKCSNTGKLNVVHGHSPKTGNSKTYTAWLNMKRRCYEPTNNRYLEYGGRGIKVCDRWLEPEGRGFINFLEDMGEKPENLTLDRRDVNDGYYKDNCRWLDIIGQANNKTNSRLYKNSEGQIYSLRRWCEILGLHYKTEWNRLFIQNKKVVDVLGEGFEYIPNLKEVELTCFLKKNVVSC